jgi:hypothetical protein
MTLSSEAVTQPGSGLVFINSYSASVTDAYRGAVIAAENFLQSHFTNSVTVSINFDYAALGAGFSAENNFSSTPVSYAAFANALRTHATTADDAIAVNGLPATDPSKGAGFDVPTTEARILGLAAQTNSIDDSVTLNSSLNFTFGQDAIGALEHEITEGVFGRTASLGFAETRWNPLDLFRFTATGQRDFTGGSDGVPTFFGLDPTHVSALQFHNSINAAGVNDGFDLGDWDHTRGDAFGPGGPGSPGTISAIDLQVLDILGWTPTSAGQPFTPAPDEFASSLADTSHPFGQVVAGGSATGALQQAGDHDWFRVVFTAGATYTIGETGHAGGGGTLADPFLQLHDASGAVVAVNDDITPGANPDSRITFVAPTTGVYYIDAGAFLDGYAGTYLISVAGPAPIPAAISTAVSGVLRVSATNALAAGVVSDVALGLDSGALNTTTAVTEIAQAAGATSSVATLSYEFFTGKAPTAAGMDFLVSPTGPNPNNLNSAYYQGFNLENRYINFAVNLGKLGDGAAAFGATYGSLDLAAATKMAYQTIFGGTPSDAKVAALLDPTVGVDSQGQAITRADYFAQYGGDGANGIGTKAAMVGWLLAEAEKADVGTYALSNDAFLTDVGLHNAPFGVDLVGTYAQPGFVFHPG